MAFCNSIHNSKDMEPTQMPTEYMRETDFRSAYWFWCLMIHVYIWWSYRERGRDREVFHLLVHCPTGTAVMAEPGRSQDPEVSSRSCKWLTRTWTLEPSSVAFPTPLAGYKVEQPGLETAPIQDAGTVGSSFTCCGTMLAQHTVFIKYISPSSQIQIAILYYL